MAEENTGIKLVTIEDEMRNSYLDYAMSVIIGRAIPDIRDGLKPVHRRILYAMYREDLLSSKRFSKSAGVVGEVLKKYHPHGDMAVYDSMVRLAQDWNMRYLLVEGQGNFGSIDGDNAAAYRYTEARLQKIAEEFLGEIDQETVDFIPNYDGSTHEPVVLPTLIPNFLVNGTTGIAVGMATSVPPHNLKEVMTGVIKVIDTPDTTIDELMEIIPGPDLPTGALICGNEGIRSAYRTGRGSITMRGVAKIEEDSKGKNRIIISEIPYQLSKLRLVEQIADAVRDKKIDGITDLRDESNREGIRVVVEVRKDVSPDVVLNHLYDKTALQENLFISMLAITNRKPKVFNLKEILQAFISHRKEVVVRRSIFELRKAQMRVHILEGYEKALDKIDAVINLIRKSQTADEARTGLVKQFEFTLEQASAILEMRLQRLTGLERDKIQAELKELQVKVNGLKDLLSSQEKLMKVIRDECILIRDKFGDERRTRLTEAVGRMVTEDLIPEEEMVVTLSHSGYIKRTSVETYRAQNRGGTGKIGMTTKDEDFLEGVFAASTHSYLLVFTDKGRMHWLKVYEIPMSSRQAKGRPLAQLVRLAPDEKVCGILPVRKFEENRYVVMVTEKGVIKKTDLMQYSRVSNRGINAINFDEGDKLVGTVLTNGKDELLLCSKDGMSIRFSEEDVRVVGRVARGVKGMELDKGDSVVSVAIVDPAAQLLIVTEFGFGKRTDSSEYRLQSRGGKGVLTIKISASDRNGSVVAGLQVKDSDEFMVVSSGGKLVRLRASDISVFSRVTQGVRIITLDEGERVTSVTNLAEDDKAAGTTPPATPTPTPESQN